MASSANTGVTDQERDAIMAAVAGQRLSSTGWVRINCPVCAMRGDDDRRGSFGFRPKTGGYRCFRCGVRGRMSGSGYVLPAVADTGPRDPVDLGDLEDYFPLWDASGWSAESLEPAREFLLRRGIMRPHMARADIHAAVAGKYAGRVIVPHKDASGEWWGFTSRLWSNPVADVFSGKPPPKVLYPPAMNRERMYNDQALAVETDEPCMIVEGCLDAVWYLPHAAAALGKPTAAHVDLLSTARRPLVIVLDGDAWEEGRALMYRLRLRGVRAGFVRLDPGDDPNSVDPTWLREQVRAAVPTEDRSSCNPSKPSPPSPRSSTDANAEPATTRSQV